MQVFLPCVVAFVVACADVVAAVVEVATELLEGSRDVHVQIQDSIEAFSS